MFICMCNQGAGKLERTEVRNRIQTRHDKDRKAVMEWLYTQSHLFVKLDREAVGVDLAAVSTLNNEYTLLEGSSPLELLQKGRNAILPYLQSSCTASFPKSSLSTMIDKHKVNIYQQSEVAEGDVYAEDEIFDFIMNTTDYKGDDVGEDGGDGGEYGGMNVDTGNADVDK
jgi:hypothetical protein